MKIKPKPKKVKMCGSRKRGGCSWAGATKMIPLNRPLAKAA